MQGSKNLAFAGVLVMLLAAIAPAAAATGTSADATTTALDGNVAFDVSPDDENETDENETFEQMSSTAAMNEFARQLQAVVANATNDSTVQAPGLVIASYAVANNPGNAPAWAGPGANAGPGVAANASVNASNGGGPPNGTRAANASNGGGPPNGTSGADGATPGGENDTPDGNETDGDDGNEAGNGNGHGPKALLGTTDGVLVRLSAPVAIDALAAPFDGPA